MKFSPITRLTHIGGAQPTDSHYVIHVGARDGYQSAPHLVSGEQEFANAKRQFDAMVGHVGAGWLQTPVQQDIDIELALVYRQAGRMQACGRRRFRNHVIETATTERLRIVLEGHRAGLSTDEIIAKMFPEAA